MEGKLEFVVPPETKFSDIIVPTVDTIRSSHLLEMLLVNKKTVSLFIFLDLLYSQLACKSGPLSDRVLESVSQYPTQGITMHSFLCFKCKQYFICKLTRIIQFMQMKWYKL